jgi:hypothetical protein
MLEPTLMRRRPGCEPLLQGVQVGSRKRASSPLTGIADLAHAREERASRVDDRADKCSQWQVDGETLVFVLVGELIAPVVEVHQADPGVAVVDGEQPAELGWFTIPGDAGVALAHGECHEGGEQIVQRRGEIRGIHTPRDPAVGHGNDEPPDIHQINLERERLLRRGTRAAPRWGDREEVPDPGGAGVGDRPGQVGLVLGYDERAELTRGPGGQRVKGQRQGLSTLDWVVPLATGAGAVLRPVAVKRAGWAADEARPAIQRLGDRAWPKASVFQLGDRAQGVRGNSGNLKDLVSGSAPGG